MLKSHMDAIENHLSSISKIPANSGHSLHKGTPREAFIKEYLQNHLNTNVSIGTGEIIDAFSEPNKSRNQFDIVIYKNNFPKLDFGGGISGFLIESVIATIEIKSILDSGSIKQAVKAANNVKKLKSSIKSSFQTGWIPPKILNYVVAYQGPSHMSTVHDWILKNHIELDIPLPIWTYEDRLKTPGTALDGIFVLKKGFIKLDNTLINLNNLKEKGIHTICNSQDGNILMLFLCIQAACNNLQASWLDPIPYAAGAKYLVNTI